MKPPYTSTTTVPSSPTVWTVWLAMPANGMLDSTAPAPMGMSSSGSNFFVMASQMSSRPTAIIRTLPQPPACRKP